ncbi:MAG: DNA replication and repair protein RecF, partial [bacterium]|nr:DNA replication and repair protein RecF [bacterium]
MLLNYLNLQNFRSYPKAEFDFSKETTFIIGPNTSGKTNLAEAIYFLSSGKSFRAEKDFQTINFGEDMTRVKGVVDGTNGETSLEIVVAKGDFQGRATPLKKFFVNGVSKKRADFMGNFFAVLFSPIDLDLIIDSPSIRRRFLDDVLDQADKDYRISSIAYEKGLRQRNALIDRVRETGRRPEKEFEYWDNVLIKNGEIITKKRDEFFEFLNTSVKDVFDFAAFYDKSVISKERLKQYESIEIGAGSTLVGPHRDDFNIQMFDNKRQTTHDVKFFGSRGQQRLVILQIKILQLDFMEKKNQSRPILIL